MTRWQRAEILVVGMALVVLGALGGARVGPVARLRADHCGCPAPSGPCVTTPCTSCCYPDRCPCEEPPPTLGLPVSSTEDAGVGSWVDR